VVTPFAGGAERAALAGPRHQKYRPVRYKVTMPANSADLSGRTFLITGANTGIGRTTAAGLARRGGKVFVACRSAEKGRAAAAEITAATGNEAVVFLPLDLADLASVRRCAAEFLDRGEPLHVLINNAGVAGSRGLTKDGFELAFGVNHLGHFALTTALLDRLAASAPARVVTVASGAHYQAGGIDFDAVRRPTASRTGMREYAVSKLANVLFSAELARRTAGRGITTYALHPGVVASDIWRRVPWPVRPLLKLRMISTEQGAVTTLYCATEPDLDSVTGRFYNNSREWEPSAAVTPELAGELWQRSEAWAAAPA
jgi:NAD(P)-dependent dehydrogenase (short-subunit alcohol dehydrogenase family)